MARLKTKGVSKSDIVRQYLGRHPKASVSQIVTALKPYNVSESLAAKIKYDDNRKGSAKPAPKTAAPAASANGSSTKADQIRDLAKSLPRPVRPRDVIAALKEKGVTASSAQVSTVLRAMGMKRKRRRRKAAAGAPAAAGNSLNINDLVAAKKLVGEVGSIEKVKEALAALARLS
jgi:transposase